jgi:hypothetical protein
MLSHWWVEEVSQDDGVKAAYSHCFAASKPIIIPIECKST